MNNNRKSSGQRHHNNVSGQRSTAQVKPSKPAEPLTKSNYANLAENVMLEMSYVDQVGNRKIDLTTNKIRNLLSLTNVLYTRALQKRSEVLDEDFVSDIQYLNVRFAYEAGRDKNVRNFLQKACILEYVKRIGTNRDELLLFCRYMESLVAYHKFYGGKDR